MTEDERTRVAEQLLAVVFGLRPDDGPVGQAWALSTASTAMARAILAHVGPGGDAEELCDLSAAQVRHIVMDTQAQFYRDKLTGRVQ